MNKKLKDLWRWTFFILDKISDSLFSSNNKVRKVSESFPLSVKFYHNNKSTILL